MNKVYKVIWSKVRNCYMVVSEIAKRNGKCSSSLNKKIIASFLAAGLVTALPIRLEAASFEGGTGSGKAVGSNAWGFRTAIVNYIFYRNGEPVEIYWDNGDDQKWRASTSSGYFSSGKTMEALEDRLLTQYSSVTWVPLNTQNATAFGSKTFAGGQEATAFGFHSVALANQATAFGHWTKATANRATAFGIETTASGRNSTSFGHSTTASGENATAFGSKTIASGGGATAFGAYNEARAENSVAWGNHSIVSGGEITIDGTKYTDLETLRYLDSENYPTEFYYLTGKDADGNTVRLGGKEGDGEIIEKGYKYNPNGVGAWKGTDEAARAIVDAWIVSPSGGNGNVAGQYSTAFGDSSKVYARNALGALGGIVEAGSNNSAAIGKNAIVKVADAIALGSGAVANRKAMNTDAPYATTGYDAATGKAYKGDDKDSPIWTSTLAAISVGEETELDKDVNNNLTSNPVHTRQITGVAAGSADTDAVNVAQLKQAAAWNVGIDENGGKVNRPDDESPLKVGTTVVGNGRNKVQFVAGKGITLTSKDYTTDTAKDTYGIVISTRFQELEANYDDQITAIWYDGNRYTIASGGTAAPAKVTTDHRALNIESIQLPKLDEQGKVVKDDQGNVVTEEYRAINSPYLHINGLQKDPANPYAGGVAVAPEYQANAAGTYAIAMGREADALQTNSIAIGHMAEAGRSDIAAVNSVALGYRAHALANNSVSVGTAAFATGNRSIAIGVSNVVDTETTEHNDERAWAAGQGSMVLGNEATAVTQAVRFNLNGTGNSPIDYNTNDAIALGTRSDARALNAIALGGNMSYTNSDGKVVYGAPEGNARNFGATVGEGAKSAIAIGGAYGTQKIEGGTVKGIESVTYAAATSYGAKGIAIGSGALIANNEDYLDLQNLIDNEGYQGRKDAYYKKRHAFTVAERKYNTYVAANGASTADPEYNDLKRTLDAAKGEYNTAAAAFSDDIRKKIALEEKNASSVEDAVAIGAGSRTGVAGGIALGSQAKAGYLDRSGTESAMTGYDMQTGLGYYGKDADDPTWKATHAALSIGTLSTSDATDRDTNITRRITNVAAGVFDRDAVNVAQLKRATTFTTDYRNVAIGTDANSYRKIQSPYAHFEGVREVSDALSITEYGKQDYIKKVSAERTTIKKKIDEYNDAITELDKRLNGDPTDTTKKGLNAKLDELEKVDENKQNKTLIADYKQLITDINYEKKILNDKISALKNELNLLPTDAGTAYDNAEALVKTQAKAYGKESIAFGKGSVVGEVDNDGKAIEGKGDQSIALGVNNTVTGNNSIGIGTGHKVYGEESGTMGDPNVLAANYSYVIGNTNSIGNTEYKDGDTITTENIFIMGNYNVIPEGQQHVYVLGSDTIATASRSVILGDRSGYVEKDYKSNDIETAGTTAGSDGYNKMVVNGKEYKFAGGDSEGVDVPKTVVGVVSVGYRDPSGKEVFNTRRIQNVAPGLISAESTDAINGSQLYAAIKALTVDVQGDGTTTDVEKTASYGGGGGSTAATTYTVKGSVTTAEGSDNITVTDTKKEEKDPKSYNYKVELNPDITVESVTAGTDDNKTVLNKDGLVINDGPSVKKNGIDAAGTTITNVGSGLGGDSNAANISDVKALTTEVADGDNTTVTSETDDNGRKTFKVNLKKDVDLTKDGSMTTGDTKVDNNGVTIANGPSMTATDGFKYGTSTLNDTGLTVGNATVQDNKIAIDGGPSMTKDGIDAGGKKITNVADAEDDGDAVNYGQLKNYAANNNQAMNDLGNQISNVDNRARKGIAGAAALAALHPLDFDPDDKLTFAAGVGHYRGENAAALGLFYRADEKVMFSLGGTVGNGENMVNAGVSFSLDRTPRVTGSRTALTKEVVALREHVARQDAQIAELTALVRQLAGNAGVNMPAASSLPTAMPAMFPDNLDNKWAYDKLEELEQQGYIKGYAGHTLTRSQFAAALDMAMKRGATLEERLVKAFEPELSHVRVAHVEGKGNEEGEWYERPRFSYDKLEKKHEIEKKNARIVTAKQK